MSAKRGTDHTTPTAAPAPGRRERNKIEKLRRIKEAAMELFTRKGFDDTTTREIAAAADVGLGTVFIYAANKRDLLFLIANDGLEGVEERAHACLDPTAPLLENLLNIFRHHYEFFCRQPALSRLVLREMAFYEAGAQARPFQETREALIRLLGKAVQAAIDRNTVSPGDTPQFVGWTLFCIYQVELRRWISQDDLCLREGMDHLQRALKVVIRGLDPTAEALSVGRPPAAATDKTPPRKVPRAVRSTR
ncbi:MAG: TetR/AcrR family transcriptional regulator [Rhodoplanes sp.]|uniref:TetR/AcrR family transcriptional regulator n=1 Tax=Rhodoplanes sp. TaxID=1968906 RepID=UPI0018372151|nr:TetR/AcrR family transcriptional regulator [Rhodoplanes sp.]NVO15270.1 TetR/AcrR family transcriptional regulator [Rhodoplanes sp.]